MNKKFFQAFEDMRMARIHFDTILKRRDFVLLKGVPETSPSEINAIRNFYKTTN